MSCHELQHNALLVGPLGWLCERMPAAVLLRCVTAMCPALPSTAHLEAAPSLMWSAQLVPLQPLAAHLLCPPPEVFQSASPPERSYLEEVSSCNIFVVKGKTIRTPPLKVRNSPPWSGCEPLVWRLLPAPQRAGVFPAAASLPLLLFVPSLLSPHCSAPSLRTCSCCARPQRCRPTAVLLQGTILPGVTRRSIIELARSRGYTVEEEPVSVTEAMEADEVRVAACARCDGCVMPRVPSLRCRCL